MSHILQTSKRTRIVWTILVGLLMPLTAALLEAAPIRTPAVPAPRMAGSAGIATAQITHTYENPATCRPDGFDLVAINTANTGTVKLPGGMLAAHGDEVKLVGTAEHQDRLADCSTTFSAIGFNWKLDFVDSTGVVTPMNHLLHGGTTLEPTFFVPTDTVTGKFVASLETALASTIRFDVETVAPGIQFFNIGPDGRYAKFTGRVTSLAFDPRYAMAGTLYAGTAQGGVWKSSDFGSLWRPVSDGKGFPTSAIGAVAVDNNGVVWAGTGDPNDFNDGDTGRPGGGIMRSTDGGSSWILTGYDSAGCQLPVVGNASAVRRILVHPTTTTLVFAAGDMGLYRSVNQGGCWTSIAPGGLPEQRVDDIAFDPADYSRLYVATRGGGVRATNDAAALTPAWTSLLSPACAGALAASVVPAPTDATRVYASFACPPLASDSPKRVLLRQSQNRGAPGSWTAVAGPPGSRQSDYNFVTAVRPGYPSVVFHGNTTLWRTDVDACPVNTPVLAPTVPSAACTWQDWNGPASSPGTPNSTGVQVHSDFHSIVFDPISPWMMYVGNDGGVYRFNLAANADPTTNWTALNANLSIAQFRTVAARPLSAPNYDVAGGLQDNGTQWRLSGRQWSMVPGGGGDGYHVSYDGSIQTGPRRGQLYFNPDAGGNSGLMTNLGQFLGGVPDLPRADPYRAGLMVGVGVAASQGISTGKLFYANNLLSGNAPNWTCIDPQPANPSTSILALAPARVFPTGAEDALYVSNQSGVYLVVVPQAPSIAFGCTIGASGATASQITSTPAIALAEDPSTPCLLYLLTPQLGGANRITRMQGSVSPTTGCASWSAAQGIAGFLPADLDGNRPDYLHRWALEVDPLLPNVVYVGTDRGLFMGRFQDGAWAWNRPPTFPDTTVVDIQANRSANGSNGKLFIGTMGRGVYQRVIDAGALYATAGGGPLAPAGVSTPLTTTVHHCALRDSDDANLRGRVGTLDVDITYDGAHGPEVLLRPQVTADGATLPHFIRETARVTTGTHSLHLQVLYGSGNAPLGMSSDGVRIELSLENNPSFFTADCQSALDWRRADARWLTVRAQQLPDEGAPWDVSVPVTIALPGGAADLRTTPFTLVITQGATVTLSAPGVLPHLVENGSVWLRRWQLVGHSVGAGPQAYPIVVADDYEAVAFYGPLEERLYLPLLRR